MYWPWSPGGIAVYWWAFNSGYQWYCCIDPGQWINSSGNGCALISDPGFNTVWPIYNNSSQRANPSKYHFTSLFGPLCLICLICDESQFTSRTSSTVRRALNYSFFFLIVYFGIMLGLSIGNHMSRMQKKMYFFHNYVKRNGRFIDILSANSVFSRTILQPIVHRTGTHPVSTVRNPPLLSDFR